MTRCSECDDPTCPGLIRCPECGTEEHGIEADSHVKDHGWCWNCHKMWQHSEGPFDNQDDLEESKDKN